MIVTREMVGPVINRLKDVKVLSVDTETSGLRPYHGDRIFSVIIVARALDGITYPFYFNFIPYPGLPQDHILLPEHLQKLKELFSDGSKTWYAHNAKFDLAMLAGEGIEILGTIHCTQAIERVVYNDYMPGGYDLDSCAERIGFKKDRAVEEYIEKNKLWTYTSDDKPGSREKNKHFDRVPFDIIVPYGERDADITFSLGQHQEKTLQGIANDTDKKLPSVLRIAENEKRLTKTIFNMERLGVKIDRPYCVRAASYEADRAEKSRSEFKRLTGKDFSASAKLFATVFADEKDKWSYTEKGNPSFDSESLSCFSNPAARAILDYRDAKSKSDFYRGFLWHADRDDIIHPNFNPGGAATGRFSSSSPNFQNLTSEESEEELEQEFVVRRAIIPRPGFVFIMPDYDQMEYRMCFDYACVMWGSETELVRKIKNEGLDPHQATADLVTALGRMVLTRKLAKNANFGELYGSGLDTLAATIGGTRVEAQALKDALREAAPEIRNLTNNVSTTARTRGFIRNWAGRRSYLKDPNWAYKMTNYLIQGGCADVVKFAMNQIHDYLSAKKSKMVLTIHDELPCEVHESEIDEVPKKVKEIMENIYPYKYLPLTCGLEWSDKSLGDKKKGFPV